MLALYLVMLITPVRLPFAGQAVRAFVQSTISPSSQIEMGEMALALESGLWPVIQFAPVVLTDSKSGSRITMDALEVGFSPLRALFGQPGANVSVVRPQVQVVQDLYGPRAARFEIVEDDDGNGPVLRVLEGEDAFPSVAISPEGISLGDVQSGQMRSDNDWLIYNLEASETGIADLVEQVRQGRFSRLSVRDGQIEMSDSVYGLFRRIENVDLDLSTSADLRRTTGEFTADIGGRKVTGSIDRSVEDDGKVRLRADATNIDFAAFVPFLDDRDSIMAMRGAGAFSVDVVFDGVAGNLTDGDIRADLTGLDLRIGDDHFPVASSIMEISWNPAAGQFRLEESSLQIGQSSARISGVFALGLDKTFGPTIGMSVKASEVRIHPNDMAAPLEPFESMEFSGWSAPLYGAMGIDRFVARKGDAVVETKGRIDMLRAGLGIEMDVAGNGVTADDLKRLWPYVMGGESRDWFVANVTDGRIKQSRMAFNFPVGSMALGDEVKPIPEGGMYVEIIGENVAIKPTDTMAPIVIDGDTRLLVDDANVTISGGGGRLETDGGLIEVRNPALVMDNSEPTESIIEISGDLSAPIPALLDLLREQQPGAVDESALPIGLDSLSGTVDLGLVATIALPDETTGREMDVDYVVNGRVLNFASSETIQDRKIGNAQLAFSASQDGYQLGGTAEIDGMTADVSVSGTMESEPVFQLGSTIEVSELAEFGFDVSDFLTGKVRFVAQPRAEGVLDMSVDLADAALNIRDLGISKARGTAGTLSASIVPQQGQLTRLDNVALAFGSVKLEGQIDYHATDGLVGGNFDMFALSAGDSASVALAPMDGGGYAVQIRGQQLDLKPMLGRFFSLGEGSGGVQATQFEDAIALDVQLERAVGYYATTAFNLDLDMLLRGTNLSRATMSAQFSEGNALSISTNPTPSGRTMTLAFNDAGTILRLLGVYSQMAGGTGSLVLNTNTASKLEAGQLILRNFSIVDEANVAQILGNHADSRAVIAQQNRLDFSAGQVDFIRSSDRVEVTEAVLAGPTIGGTARGFIYTDRREYDLTGTYVPLFSLNNVFQKIPLLGPLLGGRDGEGLVGVTFAIRGPLANPSFQINPLSILLPGAFRELFEFRARELPAPAQ